MESLIEKILDEMNMQRAVKRVFDNKGAAGVDDIPAEDAYLEFYDHGQEAMEAIRNGAYKPKPIRRVYIPKPNGEQRPLGIPTVMDRIIQQAVAQVLSSMYDSTFSEYSYGFRPNRSCHMAIEKSLEYLNSGYEWVVDLDIRKYFDTVNHDKLISILRERMNDARTLHLIRSFLQAGVMEDGLVSETEAGVPQGGPLSPILSNIYLDKLDKELEARGLRFARYADDCNIFVKSRHAADRVMKTVSSWLERKLFLHVNAEKSKVVRPNDSHFLGFKYWKCNGKWRVTVSDDRKQRLMDKVKVITCRRRAQANTLDEMFLKLNQTIIGWINYFSIADMKGFIRQFGEWMRHKVRVVILKQWKRPRTIYRNLMKLNTMFKCKMSDEDIFKVANSRLGWYRRATGNVINYLISPSVLAIKNGDRPGLVNPLKLYLSKHVN